MLDLNPSQEGVTKTVSEENLLKAVSDGSALVATIGLDRLLNDKVLLVKKSDINKASKLQESLSDRLSEFLDSDKFEKIKLGFDRNQFIPKRDLVVNFNVDILAENLTNIEDEDLKSSVSLLIVDIVSLLNSKIPVVVSRYKDSFPSDYKVSEFIRAYNTLSNPISIVDDLEMGCLSSTQVELVKNIYPSLYELIKSVLLEQVIDKVSESDYVIPYNKLKQISILLQQSVVSEDLKKLLGSNFTNEKDGEVNVKGKGDFSNITATSSEKKELKGK